MAAPAAASVRIGDLLVREGLITKEQLDKALQEQKQNGTRVGYNLVKLGFIPETELTKIYQAYFRDMEPCEGRASFSWPEVVFPSADAAGTAVALALQEVTCSFTVAPTPTPTGCAPGAPHRDTPPLRGPGRPPGRRL